MRGERPNILLVTADQWRGDCLGAAGHPTLRTPNIDALAQGGVLFRSHYAGTAPCSPARATLYTGLFQQNHRVVQNGTPLDDRFDNVARAARRAGYAPTLFGYTDTALDPRRLHPNDPAGRTYESVLPGFEVRQGLPEDERPWLSWLAARGYAVSRHFDIHAVRPEPGHRISLGPPVYGADETQTAFLAEAFLRWLTEQDAPWFAHISFLRPHPPFVVPAPYNEMYDPGDGPPFHRAATPEEDAALHPLVRAFHDTRGMADMQPGQTGLIRDLAPEDFARIRALYYGMISEVDAQIGRILDALEPGAGETLVILTSDHGEMMGDRWMLGKGGVFSESYHIPLIVRGPDVVRGHAVGRPTSAADIFPTLAERMGVTPAHVPDGRSLAPFLSGAAADAWRESAVWEFDFRGLLEALEGHGHDPRDTMLQAHATPDRLFVHATGLPPLLLDAPTAPGPLRNGADDPAETGRLAAATAQALTHRMRHAEHTLADRTVWDGPSV